MAAEPSDEKTLLTSYAYILAEMMGPDMPVPVGVLKLSDEADYEPAAKKPTREGFDNPRVCWPLAPEHTLFFLSSLLSSAYSQPLEITYTTKVRNKCP